MRREGGAVGDGDAYGRSAGEDVWVGVGDAVERRGRMKDMQSRIENLIA